MRCAICNDLEGCPDDCEDMELECSCKRRAAGANWPILIHVTCAHVNVCGKREEEERDVH